jgi:dTDP-4-dehydrorhamnose 3,5-epimerase
MIFETTKLAGVLQIHIEPRADERGFFARTWCSNEFVNNCLSPRLVQCSVSFNHWKGTLRGIHFQAEPYREAKLVRCTRGALYDVVVDLRPDSQTFREWIGIVLTAENRDMVYVPEGCGHGFLTLQNETEVFYQISEFYHPELARGVRWNDPAFEIVWPEPVEVISERDRTYPDFQEIACTWAVARG